MSALAVWVMWLLAGVVICGATLVVWAALRMAGTTGHDVIWEKLDKRIDELKRGREE